MVKLGKLKRPSPPEKLLSGADCFAPAPDLEEWASTVFISDDAVLHNPDHVHLQHARIGFLWTNVENGRQMRRIVGTCELGEPQGAMGKWPKARARQQINDWFGETPDFIITVDAAYVVECDDATFCALIEHELYHAAQEHGVYGEPKFRKDGRPVYSIRAHDVEEFVGVVRRYGASAAGVQAFVEAARKAPEIAPIRISHVCGICQARSA